MVEAPPDLLRVRDLGKRFGGLRAVADVSFTVRRGHITAIIGPNGAGKTTVFNCLTGFYRPTRGSVTLVQPNRDTIRLDRLATHRIPSEARIARTFQSVRLFAAMTVLENLLVAQHNRLMGASGAGVLALFGYARYRAAEHDAIEKARAWLEATGLTARADEPAGVLPYGAQRRLEIARAMCTDPQLLCLDEPAAGLNARESDDLNELLLRIRSGGCSILLIEHDMGVVMRISDHIVVLDHGKKISDGDAASVRADPAVIKAYLGEPEDDEVSEAIA